MSNDTTTKITAAAVLNSSSNSNFLNNYRFCTNSKTANTTTSNTIITTATTIAAATEEEAAASSSNNSTSVSVVSVQSSIEETNSNNTAIIAGFNDCNNRSKISNDNDDDDNDSKIKVLEKSLIKTSSNDYSSSSNNKESPTPKFGSRRNSSSNSKTRHCTSLPIFHNASELCEIGSRPEMDCMPLRAPTGQYHHHYHHVTTSDQQTKSLQELQNEVGALLEFRDLVIETFPDLKHKMASMSATNTLTGMASSSSLASRREWEPGIRVKRKITPKENTDIVSSSLIRSRSNSHSGKKEPKSGEGNGSVVQDSGFSTETSSSKEAHSASSTTGAMQVTTASNRLPADADDELLNLLDVIYRKSNRLRDEVEYLQNIERDKFRNKTINLTNLNSNLNDICLHKTFQDHVDKLNREDIQQLRKERDRLLDKLAEMEAETLAGRIKATKIQDQFEELCNAKKELEEQLKLALSQKLELNSRLHELQRQYGSNNSSSSSKSSSSQSESISHRNSSSTTIVSVPTATRHLQGASSTINPTAVTTSHQLLITTNRLTTTSGITISTNTAGCSGSNSTSTFQPVVVESTSTALSISSPLSSSAIPTNNATDDDYKISKPFHYSDTTSNQTNQNKDELLKALGRLDGLISSPNRATKIRVTDSKKIAAILLETNVLELQRHLLTLTVQNQVLTQRLEQATKSKIFLLKRLEKTKDEIDDVRFQLDEKDIELEGTKAQLRVLESKTPLKLDFNTTTAPTTTTALSATNEMNRSSTTSTIILSSSRDSPITSTQISTPSMKAMIPLPMMDEIQQHSSSTESAQDQTERSGGGGGGGVGGMGDLRLNSNNCFSGPETPKRSRPSKIPLPGTKGYLAPKPPTGRSPSSSPSGIILSGIVAASASSTLSTLSSSSSHHQKCSPSGPVSHKSLSRSTGSLYGKSGPPSVKRFSNDIQQQQQQNLSSLNRPESAQSNTKDNSLTGGLLNSSRSSSSSIPISSKSTPSPYKMISNSPLPKPKRDSFTSRIRHLDSLSRVNNFYSNNSNNNINNSNSNSNNYNNNNNNNNNSNSSSSPISSTTNFGTTTITLTAKSSPSTPTSPSSPPNNSSSTYNLGTTNLYQQHQRSATSTTAAATATTFNTKKDLSSSFSQGQLRDRDRKLQNTSVSVRRVSSASIGGRSNASSNVDLNQQQQHPLQQQQQHSQQQNETEGGKISKIRKFESMDSLINLNNDYEFDKNIPTHYYHHHHYHNNNNIKRNHHQNDQQLQQSQHEQQQQQQNQQQQQRQQQNENYSQQYFTSRNLINEYIAKTCIPPAILRPSYVSSFHHNSYDEEQIDLAYKHPQLLLDKFEVNDYYGECTFDSATSSTSSSSTSSEYDDVDNDESDDDLIRIQLTDNDYDDNEEDEGEEDEDKKDDDQNVDNNDDVIIDDNRKSLDNNSITTVTTQKTTTSNTTTASASSNYQTNKGIEIRYFQNPKDNNLNIERNFLHKKFVSATNYHVRNLYNMNSSVVVENNKKSKIMNRNSKNTSTIDLTSSPASKRNRCNSSGSCSSSYGKHNDNGNNPCKLIGKVNPNIARTWEQLNAFNCNSGGGLNGSNGRLLSRSISNMSDDSEKLFFCHPAVQESKSNFHVNKVIYSEEENSEPDVDNDDDNEEEKLIDVADEYNETKHNRNRTKKYQKENETENFREEKKNRFRITAEQQKKYEFHENTENFYDSIDNDDSSDKNDNRIIYRNNVTEVNRIQPHQLSLYYQQMQQQQRQLRQQQQQQKYQTFNNYRQHTNLLENQEQDNDDAGGEDMAEIDSFERKKYFWSLENEFK